LGFWMDQKGLDIEVPSFHPTFRVGADGGLKVDMVIEAVQTRMAKLDEDNDALGEFPVRGGVTLIVSQQPLDQDGHRPDPQIRYVIHNYINEDREKRQRMHYFTSGLVKHFHSDEEAAEVAHEHDEDRFQINFGLIHGGL